MAEYRTQLQGWRAIVGILVVAGFTGVQMWARIRPVNQAMKDAVRTELLQQYSGRGPENIARFVAEARTGLPMESVAPVVQRDVEFTSVGARGGSGSGIVVFRAEVTVDGGSPPDGRAVRYFNLERKFGGWLVLGESNSYNYLRELLPLSRASGRHKTHITAGIFGRWGMGGQSRRRAR
jgi:hypothetical protein